MTMEIYQPCHGEIHVPHAARDDVEAIIAPNLPWVIFRIKDRTDEVYRFQIRGDDARRLFSAEALEALGLWEEK